MVTRREMLLSSVAAIPVSLSDSSEKSKDDRREVYREKESNYSLIKWEDIQVEDRLLMVDIINGKITRISRVIAMSTPNFSKQGHPFSYVSGPIPYGNADK